MSDTDNQDYLALKWGTLKAWKFYSDKAVSLLNEYYAIGKSIGAMSQNDTPRQKEIICELIDEGNFQKVYLEWDGIYVSKDEAKKYVMEYLRQ